MWDFGDMNSTVVFWCAIVLIVLVGNYFSFKTQESRHRMAETLAQKGLTVPPELLASRGRDRYGYGGQIQSGIFLMCVGIAIAVFFWAMTGGSGLYEGQGGMPRWLPVVGIFPFMVGLARFVGGLIDRRPPPPM